MPERALADLRPYLRLLLQRRRRLLVGLLLMLLTTLAAVGLLGLSGWFITATAVTAALWASGVLVVFDVYVPGGGIRLFALTRTVARYAERLYNHDTVLRLLADLRGGLFAALTRVDPSRLARLRSAVLLNRLTADIDALDNLYLRLLAPPLVAGLATLFVAVLLALFAPLASGLATVLLLALGALSIQCMARTGGVASARQVARIEALRGRTIEQLQGLAELLAHGALARHRQKLARGEAALLRDQRRLGRRAALGNALVTLGVQSTALLVLAIGIAAYRDDTLSGAVMVLLPLTIVALGEAFGALPGAFVQFGATRAAARRVTAQARPASAASAASAAAPVDNTIELIGLGFRHPAADGPVLESVNLRIAPGEHVALLGASGSGKSTLAWLLVRWLTPTAGAVRIGGVDLHHWPPDALRARIGYLTQYDELFHDTLAANLRIAAPNVSDEALRQALWVAGLDELPNRLPDGLATWIGESGRQLSGGEARRLALARVVLRDAPIVLLDEPLSGLDTATAERVAGRLSRWLAGRTALLLAHEASALPPADRALRLIEGRIVPG